MPGARAIIAGALALFSAVAGPALASPRVMSLDQCADPFAGFFRLLGDVVWHGPRLPHAGKRFPVPYLHAAVGGTQNIQLKVHFLERAIDPLVGFHP